jgi:hypothetical protein
MKEEDRIAPAEARHSQYRAGGCGSERMPSEEALLSMSPDERRVLAARLARIDGIEPIHIGRVRYRLGIAFYTGASLFMIVWIVVLLLTLPTRYVAGQWRVAWVGYDVALLVLLAVMAWAAWRRRHIVIPIMIVTATLLLCDAWFDVTLSWGGREGWASVLTALACEVPLGVLLLIRARTVIVRMAGIAAARMGMVSVPSALHRVPLLADDDGPARP